MSSNQPMRSPRQRPLTAMLLSLVALTACADHVGYIGPMPSESARASLSALDGLTLPAGSTRRIRESMTLESFLVGPDGPQVVFVRPDPNGAAEFLRHWILLRTDGDVADLHRRMTGSVPAGLGGPLSAEYRAAMLTP